MLSILNIKFLLVPALLTAMPSVVRIEKKRLPHLYLNTEHAKWHEINALLSALIAFFSFQYWYRLNSNSFTE